MKKNSFYRFLTNIILRCFNDDVRGAMPIVILPNWVVRKQDAPAEIIVHVAPSGDLQIPLSVLSGYLNKISTF